MFYKYLLQFHCYSFPSVQLTNCGSTGLENVLAPTAIPEDICIFTPSFNGKWKFVAYMPGYNNPYFTFNQVWNESLGNEYIRSPIYYSFIYPKFDCVLVDYYPIQIKKNDIAHQGLQHYIHYSNVIMGAVAPQITSVTIVYATVYTDADQRRHQSFASLAFVRGFTGDRWIPAQMASSAENVSTWWRHHY